MRPAVVVPLVALFLILLNVWFSTEWISAVTIQFGVATVILSLVVITGYAGSCHWPAHVCRSRNPHLRKADLTGFRSFPRC